MPRQKSFLRLLEARIPSISRYFATVRRAIWMPSWYPAAGVYVKAEAAPMIVAMFCPEGLPTMTNWSGCKVTVYENVPGPVYSMPLTGKYAQ